MAHSSIDISEADGLRYLHFGSDWVQGAMRIRRPNDLVLEYTREMMAGLLVREGFTAEARWPARILIIGLGAGSLTRFCHAKLPQAKLVTVEISPAVVAAAQFHFKLPAEGPRQQIVIADAVDYIQQPGPAFDYILVDGYDEYARVGALDSEPFYQACRARLTAQGILAANYFGRSRQYTASFARLSTAFDGRACALPQCSSGNVIALATQGDAVELVHDELLRRAEALKQATGLDLAATVQRVAEQSASVPPSLRF